MTEGHFFALLSCLWMGVFVGWFIYSECKSAFWRRFAIGWLVFWCAPPLLTLWIKGVMG